MGATFVPFFFFARWHRKMADCHTSLPRVGPCWNFNTSPCRVEPFVTVPATRNTVPGRGENNGERSVDVEKKKKNWRNWWNRCFEFTFLSDG